MHRQITVYKTTLLTKDDVVINVSLERVRFKRFKELKAYRKEMLTKYGAAKIHLCYKTN